MEFGITLGPFLDRVAASPPDVSFVEPALGPRNVSLSDVDAGRLREVAAESGVEFTVHLPADNPLAVAPPEIRDGTVSYLDRALGVAAEFGARKGVVHADADRVAIDDPDTLRESVRRARRAGEDRGVEVVVENLGHLDRAYPLWTVGEVLADLAAPMCFDVGHAFMEVGQDETEEFLASYADLISHVHIHDARARGDSHIPVGSGEVDFAPVGRLLRDAGFDGTVALEVFTDDDDLEAHSLAATRDAFAGGHTRR